MTSVRRSPSPKLPPDLLMALIIALAVTGILSLVQYFLDRQRYESGLELYQRAKCKTASEHFNKIIKAFRLVDLGQYVPLSEEKKAECDFFHNAVTTQEEGKFESALLNYAKVAAYDDSPLLENIRRNLVFLFQDSKLETLATLKVCNRLGTLAEKNLLPTFDLNLLSLYPACGQIYEADKNYQRAIFTYEQFLKLYPDPVLTPEIERALARTIVTDVQEGEVERYIESPGQTGTTGDGSTVIEIKNSSPAKMQITFSGITPKFEELEACPDCIKYVNKPPEYCPHKGKVGRYILEPGQYEIAVKLTAYDGNSVNDWVGSWYLEAGAEYSSCFYIIQDPVDDLEKEEKNSL